MSGFPQELRQRLARMRLLPDGAIANRGIGERRSRAKGEGIEFEDYRPYQPGDDMRRIDPRVYARIGEPFVRQYNVGRQLSVSVILDASGSMAFGTPDKHAFARAVVEGLAFVALAGSDAVRLGVHREGRLRWSGWWNGMARAPEVAPWLAQWTAAGPTDLVGSVSAARSGLRPGGLTILVSDFWDPESGRAFELLAAAKQAFVAVQVLSPQEWSPDVGGGQVRLVDLETNEEVEATVGPSQIDRYGVLLREHVANLRGRALALGGRFAPLTTGESIDDAFLRVLPGAAVLG